MKTSLRPFSLFLVLFCFSGFFVSGFAFDQQNTIFVAPSQFSQIADSLRAHGFPVLMNPVFSLSYNKADSSLQLVQTDSTGEQSLRRFQLAPELFDSFQNESPARGPSLPIDRPTLPERNSQQGRVYLMTHTALKSFYVYPYGFSTAFENLTGQVVFGMALLSGGASLYGSYALTKNMELGYGRVAFMNYGGELLGISVPRLLTVWLHNGTNMDGARSNYYNYYEEESNQGSDKIGALLSMVGFPYGIYLGSKVNFAGHNQYGNASIMTDFSRWAYLYGYLLPLYNVNQLSDREYFAAASGLTLLLLPTGFYVGYQLVKDQDISSGRSFMVTTGGMMGAITGALLPTLMESENGKVYITSTLLGHIAGTAFGFQFRPGTDYSFGQGVFMALSAAGGAAVAISLPLIAEANEHQAYTLMGLLGGWGGFVLGEGLARSIFDSSERDRGMTSRVSFPVLWQWPAMAGPVLSSFRHAPKTGALPVKVDLIRVGLN